jgi:hypothetical protein
MTGIQTLYHRVGIHDGFTREIQKHRTQARYQHIEDFSDAIILVRQMNF